MTDNEFVRGCVQGMDPAHKDRLRIEVDEDWMFLCAWSEL